MAEEKKKERWTSIQRREKRQGKEKPEKVRYILKLKKHKEFKAALRKKRQERVKNRQVLVEKGVIKA
jgi:hypothetical protein